MRLRRYLRPLTRTSAGLVTCLWLAACQFLVHPETELLGPRLDESLRIVSSPQSSLQQITRAQAAYRDLLARHLPEILRDAATQTSVAAGTDPSAVYSPAAFRDIVPVLRPEVTEPGLHRAGIGLPMVGRIDPGGANAPTAGYRLPLTLVALPKDAAGACCDAALVDPDRMRSVRTNHGDLPVAMDLESPLDATSATGVRLGQGIANLLRVDRFSGPSRIVFLQPFDPNKTPLVLVHGLMSTPRIWAPLVKGLLADRRVRQRYQIWFFYYPTGKPVPLSALRLREALDGVTKHHGPHKPMILVGHSMGGILSRAQVSRSTVHDAETIAPGISDLPADNLVRRALVFEPRTDVQRVVFMFTPHRGSRLASSGIGALGARLIRLPATLLEELIAAADHLAGVDVVRFPTSIQGLSPESPYLRSLDRTRPTVPVHSIIGDRGRGTLTSSSDGVVSYASSHLDFAESEVVVPTGHGGIAHPLSVQELRRILNLPERDCLSPGQRRGKGYMPPPGTGVGVGRGRGMTSGARF
jgi:pimeloyl-ACP methyl ester carboxylesterase